MTLSNRRDSTSCFCNQACPAGTYPFQQYWVSAFGAPNQAYNGAIRLYRHSSAPGDPICTWDAVEPFNKDASVEQLKRQPFQSPPGQQCWQWELTILIGQIVSVWFQNLCFILPEPEGLVDPNAAASCSRVFYQLEESVLGPNFPATLRPAFPDVCDNDDLTGGVQIKPLSPF